MLDRRINRLIQLGVLNADQIADCTNVYGTRQSNNIKDYLLDALENYRSNWNFEFEHYVEIWIEKEALANIVYPIADEYGVYVNPCRGVSKIRQVYSFEERRQLHGNRSGVILYFGDLDPTGIIIDDVIADQFEQHGLPCPNVVRVALNYNQIKELNLPASYLKANPKDPRYKMYVEAYGEYIYELDTLTPIQLQSLARGAIETYRPLDKIRELEAKDIEERKRAMELIQNAFEGINDEL